MGIFFKRYEATVLLKLVGGDTCRGNVDLCGTCFSNMSNAEPMIIKLAEKQMGEPVRELLSYNIREV